MLTYLKIENLALIDQCEVEFGPGFNVVTGETGAGKSILLGAVALLLGGRADKSVLRAGAERCGICGIFSLPPNAAASVMPLLEDAGIPFDPEVGELQLRRIITPKSGRCHVNDVPVTVQLLRQIGEMIIDVHSANEHQSLTSRSCQLELLDRYAGAEMLQKECARICRKLSELQKEQEAFERTMPSPAEAEHLSACIAEIEGVNPAPGEDEDLSRRHALASNAREIAGAAEHMTQMLTEAEDSVAERLAEIYRMLQDFARLDDSGSASLMERCSVASELVRELSDGIRDFGGSVELDEEEFARVEERMSALFTLKRRYGQTLEAVLDYLEQARKRLDDFRRGDEKRRAFEELRRQTEAELDAAAEKLSRLRRARAEDLTGAVTEKLRHLGFLGGSLHCTFEEIPPGANGKEMLELQFSANPGEPEQPLRKIASSGELSRLMLALKTVLADADRVPVAIFDEIDVNIGGETAVRVGEELHQLGKDRQLLVISHLAQVAAQGDQHFVVSKSVTDGRTSSRIVPIAAEERRCEIARMLGGGEGAYEHAGKILHEC